MLIIFSPTILFLFMPILLLPIPILLPIFLLLLKVRMATRATCEPKGWHRCLSVLLLNLEILLANILPLPAMKMMTRMTMAIMRTKVAIKSTTVRMKTLGHGASYIFCQRAILNIFLSFMKCQKVLLALSRQYRNIHILHLQLFLSLILNIFNQY